MVEWKKYRLKELCSRLSSGKNISASNVSDQGLYPVYGGNGLRGYANISNFEGDCALIGRQGAYCGNVRYFSGRGYMTEHAVIACGNDFVCTRFLAYLLSIQDLGRLSAQSAQPGLSVKQLGEEVFSLPPLPTQRKIAAVLGALDDKIENNRKICANLEAQAQAIFKSWFVDDIKHIRETVQMQKVFDVTIGRTPPRKESEWFSENKDDNHVWVSIADMGSCGAFIFDSSEYLTEEAISSFNFKVVPRDTVLLSFKLTVGRVAIAATDLVTNEAIAHLRSSDTRLKEYLYCYLKQFNYDNLGSTSSIATAVNSTTIKEMPFIVPEDGALNDFHQLVKPLFNQIRVLLQESRALAAMRDALLPKLMSGEIDVEKVKVA